jgi:hypothetical protein
MQDIYYKYIIIETASHEVRANLYVSTMYQTNL